MTRGFLALILASLTLVYLLHSCANVKPPVGGPKDTIPPLIIETKPLRQSLNFKGNEIMVKFHEPIIVDNLDKKLIITPRFEEFDYKARKYEIIISLLEPLDDSTTYTFNFTDGIKDLNEGNIAREVSIAFSTGSYIDSISIDGKVVDLLTNQPVKESVVALYGLEDTVNLFTGKPMYYARTNEKGVFRFQNLRNEPYHLYAYTDINNDLLADSRSELYGFLAEPVNQSPSNPGDTLIVPITHLNVLDLELISSRPYQKYYDIKFIKSIVDYRLTLLDTAKIKKEAARLDSLDLLPIDSTQLVEEVQEDDDDTPFDPTQYWDRQDLTIYGDHLPAQNLIRVFQTFPIPDSAQFRLWAIDSVGFELDTILSMQFKPSNRPSLPFVSNFAPADKTTVNYNFRGTFRFTKPIGPANYDSLLLEYDSTHVFHFHPDSNLTWNPSRTQLTLEKVIDQALLDQIILDLEQAEELQKELIKSEALRLDSLKQLENDSLKRVLDSVGQSHTATIDSISSILAAFNAGTNQLDSLLIPTLRSRLDSLITLDAQTLNDLRPKPPSVTPIDTLVLDTLLTDSMALDSTLASLEADDSESDKKKKRGNLKLNLPKKKPKPVEVAVVQEQKQPIAPGSFRVSIPKAAFISVEGDTSGSISRNYTIKDPAKHGVIKGTIVTNHTHFTVQLLDKYFDLAAEQRNQKQYQFTNVAPGDYYLRILVDTNQNGKWDPGNVHELLEPEPVIFYEQIIPVKENWELENEAITF